MIRANVRKDFGQAVRAHRLRLGLSQESLAERAQLHRTYVTDVERGARNISLESISRLAAALELSISSLFDPAFRVGAEGCGGTPAISSRDLDILLVEDDPADVELTLAAFRAARLSNSIEVVRDGAAALDLLLQRGAYQHRKNQPNPRLVLLDLHLPKVHGLEVLQRLRAEHHTRDLQVVVLTTSQKDSDVTRALRMGARAYIIKPLDFQAFSSVTPQLDCSWLLRHPNASMGESTRPKRLSGRERA